MADTDFKIHIVSDADNTGFKSAGAASEDLTQSTKKGAAATGEDAEASKKSAKEVEGLEIKKRELLESTRALTREFPLLREIMAAVYNPIAFTVFGIIGAFEIWTNRVKTLTEALGGILLPNFGAHIKDAENIATAYDGIAKSVKGADEEFNSAASAFERHASAINAQLVAIKALIAAQKEKAIADLDMERASGKLGTATYDAKKAIIEQGYNDKTTQAEIDARNAELQAKKTEEARLKQEAAKKSGEASAIKLPQDDREVDAQIAEFKDLAAALKKQAETHRAEIEKLQEVQSGREASKFNEGLGGLKEGFKGMPEEIAYDFKYGMTTDPAAMIKLRKKSAKEAEDNAAAAEKSAARIEKEKADREKLRQEAEKAAADHEKLRLENAGQDDPNKVGSVAWQNAQAAKTQHVRDTATGENRFTKDIENFNKDAEDFKKNAGRTDPQGIADARKAMADMFAAVTDAMSVVTTLANSGVDVATMRKDIAGMKQTIAALQSQVNSTPGSFK
jgi:hypothetical protein